MSMNHTRMGTHSLVRVVVALVVRGECVREFDERSLDMARLGQEPARRGPRGVLTLGGVRLVHDHGRPPWVRRQAASCLGRQRVGGRRQRCHKWRRDHLADAELAKALLHGFARAWVHLKDRAVLRTGLADLLHAPRARAQVIEDARVLVTDVAHVAVVAA